jgi:hypothetical protein
MKPISNIVYSIQYLTICCILDLQENIYKNVKKADYISVGSAGRHVVGFGNLRIDVFVGVQNQNLVKY